MVVRLRWQAHYWWQHPAEPAQATSDGQPHHGRGGNNGGGRRPLAPVQAATATTESVPYYLSGLGTVTAANTVTVRSRVDGC